MLRIAFAFSATLAMFACFNSQAHAAQCGNSSAGFAAWKQEFAGEARAKGVSAATIQALMATNYAQATINADRGQRSFRLSLDQFLAKRGATTIVAKGRQLKQSQAALFASIQSRYGVPPGPLLAIWGMETGFGSQRGNQNMLASIATLAYDCRRSAFFTEHLYAALQLIDRGALSPTPARLDAWRSRPDPVHAQSHFGLRHRQSRKRGQRADLDRELPEGAMAGAPAPATSRASRTLPPSRPGMPRASIRRRSR